MLHNRTYLFLHGWGTKYTVWRSFSQSFSNVCVPCLYEVANKTKNNSFEFMAAEINKLIKNDVVIIAWSMGGLIALPLAKLSKKINAIVFISSTPCFVNKQDWPYVIDKNDIEGLQGRLSKNSKTTLEYFSGLIAHGDPSAKSTNKVIREQPVDEKNGAILFSWLMQMIETDQREIFSELKVPIQIILGENDCLINPDIEVDLKQLNLGIKSRIINDCGHAPFISQQQQTTKIINEFINAELS